MTIKHQQKNLAEEYPLLPYTDASRTFSMVRRMKAERENGIPIALRSGYAISTKTGKAANTMTGDEWEQFYSALSEQLKRDYPELYGLIFSR